MAKLICPECGGVIGSKDPADLPCTCLAKSHEPDDADYAAAVSTEEHTPDPPVESESEKTCRICGKDVTGTRRYKDSLGYWCLECHRADAESRTAGQARCSGCSRLIPRQKLVEIDGERFCYTCNRQRITRQQRTIRKAASGRIHTLHERKQLLVLLAIFALLLIIIILQRLGVI